MTTWKRRKVDREGEQELLTGMIVDDNFLQQIIPVMRLELLNSSFTRTVARWCMDYYTIYKKAPKETIQELYNSEVKKGIMDDAELNLISSFLSNLSSEYEKNETHNTDYLLDKAELFLKTRALEQLKDDISSAIINHSIQDAERAVANFHRIERPHSIGIDILKDTEQVLKAFHEEEDIMFQLPGDLGQLAGPFCREDFVSISAPAKRGKTWWLQEIGLRGLFAGFKVLFISLEMSEREMIKRLFQGILGETKRKVDYQIDIPYLDDENRIQIKSVHKRGLSANKAIKKSRLLRKLIKTGQFRLYCAPSNSMSISGLVAFLDNLEHYNKFVPDIIVLDYADYLMSERGIEYRHQLDYNWKSLRGLAQERHALMVTATHSNRATFSRDQTQADIVEDIRKLNHVTLMLALNQNAEDKRKGVMRLSTLGARHEDFQIEDEVVVLQCLSIGKPYLNSIWKNKLNSLEE